MQVKMFLFMLIIYLAVTVLLAYTGYRRTRSQDDYLIAGGEVSPVLMALAYGSTFISTSAIVGFGGAAAVYGLSMLWLTFFNIFVGIFIAFTIYGRRTLEIGRQLGARTFPELLGRRFNSLFIQRLAAVIIALAMPLYAAAVMIGAARFIEQVLAIKFELALVIFALIVAAYVITGGLKSVIYNDAFQSTIMLIGMTVLLLVTYQRLGGVVEAHRALTALQPLVPASMVEKGHAGWTSMPVWGSEYWYVLVTTLVLGVGIGVLAQPQLVVRFLTVPGVRQINRAVAVGGIFILMMTGVAFVVGALSNVWFVKTTGKIALMASAMAGGKPNVDNIIPLYVATAMPSWFTYLFMFTLLAAAMSTLSGQLHVIGTSLCHDLLRRQGLLANRLALLAAVIVSLFLALKLPGSIIAIATAMFFGLCAAVFLPAYTAALFWPGISSRSVTAGMITGLVVAVGDMVFIHAKEATALTLCQKIFGVPTLLGFPWTVLDPLVIALPASALVTVVAGVVEGWLRRPVVAAE